jgi:hypothetical protein
VGKAHEREVAVAAQELVGVESAGSERLALGPQQAAADGDPDVQRPPRGIERQPPFAVGHTAPIAPGL